MTKPTDLRNHEFGQLTVVERLGPLKRGYLWRCRCRCGRVEDIPQYRLAYNESNKKRRGVVLACDTCRNTHICKFCKSSFYAKRHKACCSKTCHQEHQRRLWREDYYRKLEADPNFNQKRIRDYSLKWRPYQREYARRRREGIAVDPVRYRLYLETQRQANQRCYEKTKANPERLAALRRKKNEYKQRRALDGLMQTGQALERRNDD